MHLFNVGLFTLGHVRLLNISSQPQAKSPAGENYPYL